MSENSLPQAGAAPLTTTARQQKIIDLITRRSVHSQIELADELATMGISVTQATLSRDLAEVVTQEGFTINRDQFSIAQPIKTLGLHTVPVVLHPEVEVSVTVNVARSPEEAERQARGEEVTTRDELDLDELGLEVGAALAEGGEEERA